MSDVNKIPAEGIYRGRDGQVHSVANLRRVEDDFFMFDLFESDDPEDLEAIATELTSEEWPEVVSELGLFFVKDFD